MFNSKNIIDALSDKNLVSAKALVRKGLSEISLSHIERSLNEIAKKVVAEAGEEAPDKETVQGTEEDPILDPALDREYFLKSFEENGVFILIKTIGVGKNKPVSVYLDDIRWEMFPGPKNAEKEAKEFVSGEQYEKWKERKGLNQPVEEPEEEVVVDETPEEEEETPALPINKKGKKPSDNKKKMKKESVLVGLKRVLSEGKPQKISFNNKESMEADVTNASYVVSMHESLNKRNKVEFERVLNKSKSEFVRAIEFSYKNLIG